ncbi:hypothetical protein NUSPORA_00004 [Nucleospora cyclopteri]
MKSFEKHKYLSSPLSSKEIESSEKQESTDESDEENNPNRSILEEEDMSKLTYRQQLLALKYRENIEQINPLFRIAHNLSYNNKCHSTEKNPVLLEQAKINELDCNTKNFSIIRLHSKICFCRFLFNQYKDFVLYLKLHNSCKTKLQDIYNRLALSVNKCQCNKTKTTFKRLLQILKTLNQD